MSAEPFAEAPRAWPTSAEPADCDRHPLPTLDETLARMLSLVAPLAGQERISLLDAPGRVLAEPLYSPLDVPPWDNSAMDGYALRAADVTPDRRQLPVSQRIPAGTSGTPLQPGTLARIFTGAPIPAGADTVVIQEDCTPTADGVRLPEAIRAGANIRRAGEDIRAGAEIIGAGVRLQPAHVALAASVGVAHLAVRRRPRVAMLATGDELVMPGVPLAPGQIYHSNRYLLHGLLNQLGAEVQDLGIVPDRFEATLAALEQAARDADLIVASGGVSVGEEDHVKPALERLGRVEQWQVAVRPGKPLVFGFVADTPFLGCPGNPVSLFVSLCLFARPLLLRLLGSSDELAPPRLRVRADFDWPRPDRRRPEYHRARLRTTATGETLAAVHPSRSSAALSSVAWADALVELPPGQVIQRGDWIDALPFSSLFA